MNVELYRYLTRNRDKFLSPLTRVLAGLGITPTMLNLLGVLFGFLSSIAFIKERRDTARNFLLISGVIDTLDGPLARTTKSASPLGTVFDASCDRAIDVMVYSAILIRAVLDRKMLLAYLSWTNLVIDTTRSYLRARAESELGSLGTFEIGIMTRPRKFALFLIGIAYPRFLFASLLISVLFSIIGLFQRLHSINLVYKSTKKEKAK